MGAENPASRLHELETNLAHVRGELAAQRDHNARLISTLREAREQIVTLKQELDRLAQPPNGYGTFISRHEDNTIDISLAGRKMRVTASPTIDVEALRPGQELVVNEAMNVVDVREFESVGEIVTLKERLSDGRALVVGHTDDERVVRLAGSLNGVQLRAGDALLCDIRSNYAIERVPKAEVEELILEEVPNIQYEDIGGLRDQIEAIRDAVELPFLHADLYAEHQLKAPKGILLYGLRDVARH